MKDNDPAHPSPPIVAPSPPDDIKSKDEWNVMEAHVIWLARQTKASTRSGKNEIQTNHLHFPGQGHWSCLVHLPMLHLLLLRQGFSHTHVWQNNQSHFYDNTVCKEHVFKVLSQNYENTRDCWCH